MKKLILLLLALAPASMALCNDWNDKPIEFERLPVKAQQFVKQNFSVDKLSVAIVDDQPWDTAYEVFFTDGSKIEFNGKGEWEEIDCKYTRVPEGAVPAKIMEYIKKNRPDNYVKSIERNRRKYEVKLDVHFELIFDLNFNLIGYDD
jgi:hypothetical protein